MAKGVKGYATVEGVAYRAPNLMMHMVVVDTGRGKVVVSLAGCWKAPDDRVYMGHVVASAAHGRTVEAYGLLIDTRLGPVLVAEEVRIDGVTLEPAPCPMHMPTSSGEACTTPMPHCMGGQGGMGGMHGGMMGGGS